MAILRKPMGEVVELIEKRHSQICKIRGGHRLLWHIHSINSAIGRFIPEFVKNISRKVAGIISLLLSSSGARTEEEA
jgi:hypothetical protein